MLRDPYVPIPEPEDEVYIVQPDPDNDLPGWTWGEHRHMAAMLKELEEQDQDVAAARQKLDYRLREAGWLSPEGAEPTWCVSCHKKPEEPHDHDCPHNNDPALWVKRERAAYQWLDAMFTPLHTSSVPMDDEEALDYSKLVELWFPGRKVKYLWGKDLGSNDFKMLPYQIEVHPDDGEVYYVRTDGQ